MEVKEKFQYFELLAELIPKEEILEKEKEKLEKLSKKIRKEAIFP